MHLIDCSCHITLSADTYHLCDIRIRMPAAGVCHHFHVFACIVRDPVPLPPGQRQVNNRDALAGDWNLQDWKMTDEVAGVEFAGLENDGLENDGPSKNGGWNCRTGK